MKIAGIGCCTLDYLYGDFRYDHPVFQQLLSRSPGDGGIIPGGLVFSEDVEEFSGKSFVQLLKEMVGDAPPDAENLGGPSCVALVHASQMLGPEGDEVIYYGAVGDDPAGRKISGFLDRTPVKHQLLLRRGFLSPATLVLSDPTQHGGKGERSFINTIGAAGTVESKDVPEECYDADILLCGGTALVPRLHEQLDTVLKKAKERGCITVVGTVYDFKNEKRSPGKPWPMGSSRDTYRFIDVLITDAEEALKLTGSESLEKAAEAFARFGAKSVIITHGAKQILVYSGGGVFAPQKLTEMPVSRYVDDLLDEDPRRRKDSTGCGDNFVGGVITSLSRQMKNRTRIPDIREVCAWGAASGGFTCMYHGGTYYESRPGEKREAIEPIASAYRKQAGLPEDH